MHKCARSQCEALNCPGASLLPLRRACLREIAWHSCSIAKASIGTAPTAAGSRKIGSPKAGRAGRNHVAGDDIKVDDRHADGGEEVYDGAIRARDAAGGADAEHGGYRRASVQGAIATSPVIACVGTRRRPCRCPTRSFVPAQGIHRGLGGRARSCRVHRYCGTACVNRAGALRRIPVDQDSQQFHRA